MIISLPLYFKGKTSKSPVTNNPVGFFSQLTIYTQKCSRNCRTSK